jgi:hypothetical protein
MKKSGFVTLFLSALSLLAEATGSVKYELQKLGAGLAQGGSIEAALTSRFAKNFGQAYYLNVSVGTPGQLQTVMIDTGARDFIVTASSAPACEVRICAGGTFNSTESSTLHTVARDGLDVTYGDWSTRSGDYITDVVRIGTLRSRRLRATDSLPILRVPQADVLYRRCVDHWHSTWACL